jgi:hypothetical protein
VSLQQSNEPIIVRVVEQPVHETTISDVIFGSIGLVGVLLLAALLLGVILGGVLILLKRLTARDGLDPRRDAENLRVTPTSPGM